MRLSALATTLVAVTLASSVAHADDIQLTIPKPTIGIAAAIGQTFVENGLDAETVTLEGRLNFGRVELAGEIGKSEYTDDARVDRHLGGSLYFHLGKGQTRPVLSVGGGLLRSELPGGLIWDMAYGRVGAGVLRQLSDQVDISVEAVLGRRVMLESNQQVLPLAYYIYWPEEEDFGQVQLKLIIRL